MKKRNQPASQDESHSRTYITACGLWEREFGKGETVLSGTMGAMYVSVFVNKFKDSENAPDYYLKFSQRPSRRDEGSEPF